MPGTAWPASSFSTGDSPHRPGHHGGEGVGPPGDSPGGEATGQGPGFIGGYAGGIPHRHKPRRPAKGGTLPLERFISEDTSLLPDIDLDFPRGLRDELIQRVHRRFGPDHAVLAGAIATYSPKASSRTWERPWGCRRRTCGSSRNRSTPTTARTCERRCWGFPPSGIGWTPPAGATSWRWLPS